MNAPRVRLGSLVGAVALGAASVAGAPDAVYVNGKVVTVDDRFSIVEGFAVEADRFVATGTAEAMLARAEATTQVVDLKGRTVVPGLIDNHNHFVRGAQHWRHLVRLEGVTTKAEALGRLRDFAAGLTDDQWLIALGGWNEEQFADADARFTLAELDAVAGGRPAFLQVQYDHAFVNSAFLEHFGIDPNAPGVAAEEETAGELDLEALTRTNGRPGSGADGIGRTLAPLVERDQRGIATGYLAGAMRMVIPVTGALPSLSEAELLEGVRAAQAYYNSLGLTATYDPAGGLITEQAYRSVETLHAADELTIRVFRTRQYMLATPEHAERAARQFAELPPMLMGDHYYDTLAIGEAFYVPLQMIDSMEARGPIPDEHVEPVRLLLESLLRRGLAAQIHVVRSETIDLHLELLEELSRRYTLFPGQICFTHAELVTSGQLARIRELGISLQLRSMSVLRRRDALIDQYGAMATRVPPLRLVQDSGVSWGLGTDGSKASQVDPLVTLEWAVTGRALNGDRVLEEDQLLTREEALIAHTRGNARMLFRENSLGQIRPGFLADFVVLDGDYLEIDAASIDELRVLRTVVGGRVVHDTGSL